jgi:hypothetical protein
VSFFICFFWLATVIQAVAQSSINNKGEFGMLKKFLKVALAACLVAGMASVTMAADDVKFSVQAQALMGQVSPGTKNAADEDNPAYLDTVARNDFQVKMTSGKMYSYIEIQSYYFSHQTTVDYTGTKIGYNFDNPGQFIEIGKIWIGAPFSYEFDGVSTHSGSSVAGSGYGGWGYRSGWCCQSDWGIKYNMLLSPTMGIMAAYTTGTTMYGVADGSSIGASWWGIFGPLQARVGIDNETAQDVTTKDAESYAGSFQYAGVMYAISDTMSVGLDLQIKSVDVGAYGLAAGETWNDNEMALLFKAMKLGPGNLYFQYATDTRTASYDSDYELKDVYTNLFYKIPVDKGVGIEVLYLAKSSTTKTAAGTSDPVGPTTIGGGFYARF